MDTNIIAVNASESIYNITNKCPRIDQNPNVILITQLMYGIVCVLGIFGNTLVIYVVSCFSKMQTTTNIYILNLALADVCFLIGIPFLIVTMSLKTWIFGSIFCKIYMTTTSINQITSSIFLLIMSFDRYLAICHPISMTKLRTQFVSRILSITAWLTSAIIIMPVIIYSRIVHHDQLLSCNIAWKSNPEISGQIFTIYTSVLGFYIPLTLIMTFYVLVLKRVRKLGPKNRATSNKYPQHKKVTKLVVTIIVVYVLCWFPYYTSQLILIFSRKCQTKSTIVIHLLAGCLSYSNSAINPILYTFLNDNFKTSFLNAFTCHKRGTALHNSGLKNPIQQKTNV